MLLSKPKILKYIEDNKITISPFNIKNLGSSQYDVTLGENFYREKSPDSRYPMVSPIYNPYDEKDVLRRWDLCTARTHEELINNTGCKELTNIDLKEKIILINPGETILAHTEEFIGGSCNRITTMMKARSSMGRNGIEVCKCAGMGDVGYFNRWTMEITNNSQHVTIPLVVGRRIAQILFFEVNEVLESDVYDQGGKYQQYSDLEMLKSAWRSEEMLPKQWKDREVRISKWLNCK
jgi:dCTP deaminase